MLIKPEDIPKLLLSHCIIDVRSPAEFEKGHIPGALNLPLFGDKDRARVGTVYKREGRESAVSLGLKIVGPQLHEFVTHAKAMANDRPILLYCWRGGLRSASMAWLLRTASFDVTVLEGGYKAFRSEAHRMISQDGHLLVLGGYTGSAKTDILNALRQRGAHVIDLEGLALHKGSAFGGLTGERQPSTEQFLNLLWEQWAKFPADATIWIEDESRTIGSVWVPEALHERIRHGTVIVLKKDRKERADFLAQDYGDIDLDVLKQGFQKIETRLGGQHLKTALEALEQGNLAAAAEIALTYYDKTYEYGLSKRNPQRLIPLEIANKTPSEVAERLLSNNFNAL